MIVVFRVDASIEMGSGHVMRCLTLADALRKNGVTCHFICREHQGNLLSLINDKGFVTHALPQADAEYFDWLPMGENQLAHASWLGVSQHQDAEQCAAILANIQPNWLVVDHYALDINWEIALSDYYDRLMVIDDLADRHHNCDLLLDQTFGRNNTDYKSLVPDVCTLLCGSQYALLRPEFAALRSYSLLRRKKPKLEHLLITMGGVDKDNATGQVLAALRTCELPELCKITVVMGATAPWLTDVSAVAADMPWPTTVQVNISNMAQLMTESDLAIGAAGSTAWERCCLGLPTIMLVLAENQQQIAANLEQVKAAQVIEKNKNLAIFLPRLLFPLVTSSATLTLMTKAATSILNGQGVIEVIKHMEF